MGYRAFIINPTPPPILKHVKDPPQLLKHLLSLSCQGMRLPTRPKSLAPLLGLGFWLRCLAYVTFKLIKAPSPGLSLWLHHLALVSA